MRVGVRARSFLLLAALVVGCVADDGATELGTFGIGETLLETPVNAPAATGGPQAGKFKGVSFTVEQSAAVLILTNQGTATDLKSAGLTTAQVNSLIAARPLTTMSSVARDGIGEKTLQKLRAFAPTWPGLAGKTPPDPTPGEVSFHLVTSTSFTASLAQTSVNDVVIQVGANGVIQSSDRSQTPQISVTVPPGLSTDVMILVRNYGRTPLTGTLTVRGTDTSTPSSIDVMFTNPLCHDTSTPGTRDGARCTGSDEEKDDSRDQAGIWRRIIGMVDAARVYKQAHPEAPVTIYMAYLSWYYDGGMLDAVKAALDAGVQFRGYYDSHGDVGMPEAVEELGHPNAHIGWLGGQADPSGLWRLLHIKLTMIDFGTDAEPSQLVFSSANLSPSGSSIHFENFVFATQPRQSNFVQRHLCAMQALEADRYPSRYETDDHEVIFESVYDQCVSQIAAPVDPHMLVFFSPDEDARSLDQSSALGYAVAQLNQATTSLDMAIEHFSQRDLAYAILGPKTGAPSIARRLVMDDQTLYMDGEASVEDNAMWWSVFSPTWAQERVQQRFVRTNANIHQLQHNKYIVIDNRRVLCGAGNFTNAGFKDNYENFYVLDDPALVTAFHNHFEHLFNDLGSRLDEIPAPKPPVH